MSTTFLLKAVPSVSVLWTPIFLLWTTLQHCPVVKYLSRIKLHLKSYTSCRNMRISLHREQAGVLLITQLNFNSFNPSTQIPSLSKRHIPINTFLVKLLIRIYFFENFIYDTFLPYSQKITSLTFQS